MYAIRIYNRHGSVPKTSDPDLATEVLCLTSQLTYISALVNPHPVSSFYQNGILLLLSMDLPVSRNSIYWLDVIG